MFQKGLSMDVWDRNYFILLVVGAGSHKGRMFRISPKLSQNMEFNHMKAGRESTTSTNLPPQILP
jgi:hypothetical protein